MSTLERIRAWLSGLFGTADADGTTGSPEPETASEPTDSKAELEDTAEPEPAYHCDLCGTPVESRTDPCPLCGTPSPFSDGADRDSDAAESTGGSTTETDNDAQVEDAAAADDELGPQEDGSEPQTETGLNPDATRTARGPDADADAAKLRELLSGSELSEYTSRWERTEDGFRVELSDGERTVDTVAEAVRLLREDE